MAIYDLSNGNGYKVILTTRVAGKNVKREKSFYFKDFPGKRACKNAAEEQERDYKDEFRILKKQALNPGSLTVNTFGDILNLFKKTPYKSGKNIGMPRVIGNESVRYALLEKELGKLKPWEVRLALRDKITYWMDTLDYAPATINKIIAIATAAMDTAYKTRVGEGKHESRLIPENYLEDFPQLNENNIRFRVLTESERLILWNRLGAYPPLQKLYYHALSVPMRMSELVNIRRSHCNAISGCIEIPDPKAGRARTIRVPEGLLHDIRHWPEGVDYLHHDEHGNPLGYYCPREERIIFNRRKQWDRAVKGDPEAGDIPILGYNFHKTRQEAVMMMYQDGKSMDHIMMLGGWQSEAAFLRYFSKEIALEIDNGLLSFDKGWKTTFPADIRRVA